MAESTRLLNGRREKILTEGSNPSRSVLRAVIFNESQPLVFLCKQHTKKAPCGAAASVSHIIHVARKKL